MGSGMNSCLSPLAEACSATKALCMVKRWQHTPGDAQKSKRSTRFVCFPRRRVDFPRLPWDWLNHTTGGLWDTSCQLIQSPAKANKNFLIIRFPPGLPRSLVPLGDALKWGAGRIRVPPAAPHRSRATLSNGAGQFLQPPVFPEIPTKVTCVLLVLQNNGFPPKVWDHGHAYKPHQLKDFVPLLFEQEHAQRSWEYTGPKKRGKAF